VFRLTLEPGAVLPGDPTDPSGAFVVLESGEPVITGSIDLAVAHAGADRRARVGTWCRRERTTHCNGDSLYGAPFETIGLRNDGDVPAILLVIAIAPAGDGEATLES
jgi:hypothetical protein